MTTQWFRRILTVALIIAPFILLGQDAPLPDSGDPPCGPPFGPVCPIDGGISFLIAAGMALGGKKAYDIYRQS